jgi:hypothetical protein
LLLRGIVDQDVNTPQLLNNLGHYILGSLRWGWERRRTNQPAKGCMSTLDFYHA